MHYTREGALSIGAALLVLFSAMLDPKISVTIAAAALTALGLNALRTKR